MKKHPDTEQVYMRAASLGLDGFDLDVSMPAYQNLDMVIAGFEYDHTTRRWIVS